MASVHGDSDRLAALHHAIAPRLADGDRLVYLGNLIGRGSAIVDSIDEALGFRAFFLARPLAFVGDVVFLRGAQEEMWQKLLELQFAPNPREVLGFMLEQGVGATIEAYGGDRRQGEAACRDGPLAITRWTSSLRQRLNQTQGHSAFMASLRRAAYSDEGKLLFVHAGLDATKPLDLQGDAFWWGGGAFLELERPYGSYRRVVRGFDRRHAGLVEGPHALSLDGGCGFGGTLIAACLDSDGTILDGLEA